MRRPVLIVLACAALLLVAGVPFLAAAHRRAARADLAAVLHRHATEGHGASFTDLAASAPPVDGVRQMRARAWMKKPVPTKAHGATPAWIAWRLEGETPDAAALEAHEAFRPMAEALAALLEPGDLCLTSLGWLPADPARATFKERVGGFIPNLLSVRAACRFYALEASLAEDPTPALDALDRLHRSMDRPGGLIDAMIAVACDDLRDEAYVVLRLGGAVDDARLDAWLAEAPRGRRLVADALRGERLRIAAPLAQDLVAGVGVAEHVGQPTSGLDDLWAWRIRPYFDGPHDCALFLDALLMAERQVRGQVGDAETQAALDACSELGEPFGMMLPNLVALRSTGASTDEMHAALRAALVLVDEARARDRVPADDGEAHRWVAAARPAIAGDAWRYERVAADRIRVLPSAASSTVPPGKGPRPAFRRVNQGVELDVR